MIGAPREVGGEVVVIEAMTYEAAVALLSAAEAAHARALPARRAHEWAVGRACLRQAIRATAPTFRGDLLVNDRGAPVVDAALRASLSHKQGVTVAWAQRTEALPASRWHLGIDIETLAPPRQNIEARVLVASEVARMSREPTARAAQLKTIFAIKEAVYKAIDPMLRRYVGFAEVEVWPRLGAGYGVTVFGHPDLCVRAATALHGDAVIAMAWAQAAG